MDISQNTKEEKLVIVKKVMDSINKTYGAGSVLFLDNHKIDIETQSTGSISIDLALGGGIPRGRIIEIYGPESSGKTTLTLHVIAECQKNGGIAAFIDAEHAFDLKYAQSLGIDTDNVYLTQPSNGEEGLQIAEQLISTGAIKVCVVDSVAALVPKAEIDGEMGDSKMGLHARLMSQALRKLAGIVSKTNTILIFINQVRDKIGVPYGNPLVTTGGNALKFYASQRIETSRSTQYKNLEGDITGNLMKIKVVKNKIASPFKSCEVDIAFGKGIDFVRDLLKVSVDLELITKRGAYHSLDGLLIGNSKEAAYQYLLKNPKIQESLKNKINNLITI